VVDEELTPWLQPNAVAPTLAAVVGVKPPSGARGVPLIEVLQDGQIGSLNPDSAVPADAMSEEQTFRSEVMPFGIANGKSQIPKYGICNL
jgi:hypothetical protein